MSQVKSVSATKEMVNAAYAELEKAVIAFNEAIDKFGKVYSPDSVGLEYWKDANGFALEDIDSDIEQHFQE